MLRLFGAEIEIDGGRIALTGEAELRPQRLSIPGDASAAAFLAVAALIVPGSEIRIEGVGVNPVRTGLYEMLAEMGGDVAFSDTAKISTRRSRPIVRNSALTGNRVPPESRRGCRRISLMSSPPPFAREPPRPRPAELRLKESDRNAGMRRGSPPRRCGRSTGTPSAPQRRAPLPGGAVTTPPSTSSRDGVCGGWLPPTSRGVAGLRRRSPTSTACEPRSTL